MSVIIGTLTRNNATTPTRHPAKTFNPMKERYQIWRVWLRLQGGGIIAIPFPAASLKRAEELREKAAETFQGRALWLEYVGELCASTNEMTMQPEPPRKCPFCIYQREGCEGTEDGEPCPRFKPYQE